MVIRVLEAHAPRASKRDLQNSGRPRTPSPRRLTLADLGLILSDYLNNILRAAISETDQDPDRQGRVVPILQALTNTVFGGEGTIRDCSGSNGIVTPTRRLAFDYIKTRALFNRRDVRAAYTRGLGASAPP